MIQPRIDALAALAEAEGKDGSPPYLVTMVGDSTMMHQHGAMCSFLAERPGRRFDPAVRVFVVPGGMERGRGGGEMEGVGM